jgi:superfamily II DNA or RNA helicase
VHKQPIETGAMAVFDYDEALAKKFVLMTRFNEPYSLYERQGPYLFLPRGVAQIGAVDNRVLGNPINVKLIVGPKDAEQARMEAEQNALLKAGESFILRAGTGMGKTWLAASAINCVQRQTLVVVPKEDLMGQFRERMKTFLGLKDHQIGIIQADKVNVIGKPVVLGMVHSLAKEDRYDPSVFAGFGLILFDETHRMAADSLSKCFRNLPARIRVGYSATPKRADGKEQLIYSHIGPERVSGEGIPMIPKVLAFKTGYKIPRVMRKDDFGRNVSVQLPHQAGKTMHITAKMAVDPSRNDMIGKLARMAYDKGRLTIAFTHTLDHIEAMLASAHKHGIPLSDTGRYVGGMSEAARKAAETKRFVAVTYGMMKEGTDWPHFDTAILASPLADVRQAVGRVIRTFPDKREPLVMDMIDDDSRVFAAYWKKRLTWYASIGAKVVEM